MSAPAQPSDSVYIEKAEPADAGNIKIMVDDAYSKYIERIGHPPAPMLADHSKLIEAGNVYVLRTTTDGKAVGAIHLYTVDGSMKVNNVVVDSRAQGKGYGRLLMNYAEETAKRRGIHAITLFTNEKMYENLVLYPKLGYKEVDRREEDGFNRVYFRKDL